MCVEDEADQAFLVGTELRMAVGNEAGIQDMEADDRIDGYLAETALPTAAGHPAMA